ncbi:MAG TPA: ATP synthase F1 subunit gamma [Candidatus Paceibacterota bacterium]|nr:ATP synthase F1 subunit gamma [Candidatus Paceibacterota bacterium]
MALKDIKTKIQATLRTHKVTRAMEAVSAVKMRKTQARAIAGRAYARAALSILARLASGAELATHPLTKIRPVRKVALVVITSDKGLAGALNSGVLKAAAESIATYAPKAVTLYAYGKKGEEYFARRAYAIARTFENRQDTVEFSVMEDLTVELSREFADETYDEVLVAYSNFKSTFEQVPTVRRLLPLTLSDITQLVEDIIPVKGKWSDSASIQPQAAYTLESRDRSILDTLLPRLLTISLYHFLLEAKASEHSARMVAMKSASDKSKEVAHDLTRLFNKIRQAAITREVSEIISGREALAT